MKKEKARTYMVSICLLLLTLSSFFVGFTVNEIIHSKAENGNVATIQYRVIPGDTDNRPEVKSVIHARVEVLKWLLEM